MKYILYICIWIVGGNCPMKAETRTPHPDTFVRDSKKREIMKEIKLTQGYVALVDDEDFNYLKQFKWYILFNETRRYAMRSEWKGSNKTRKIMMHREIMQTPSNLQVDHIDHNGLNNQKANLRNCTSIENGKNRSPYGRSKYLGVSIRYHRENKAFISAAIRVNGIQLYLGVCKTELQAAKRYDAAASYFHGKFANLNFKIK